MPGFIFAFSHIVAHGKCHYILAKGPPTSLQHELFNQMYTANKQTTLKSEFQILKKFICQVAAYKILADEK